MRVLACCGLKASVREDEDRVRLGWGNGADVMIKNGNLRVYLDDSASGYISVNYVSRHPRQNLWRMMDMVNEHVNLGSPLGSLADAALSSDDVMPLARWTPESHHVVSSRAHRERVRVALLCMRRSGLPWPAARAAVEMASRR